MNNAIVALSDLGRGRGGGGTPLDKPYRYVAPQRVGLFSPFDLITGVGILCPFWSGIGIPRSTPPPGTGNWMVYDIDEPFSFETQFNNDNTVCIVSNLSTVIQRF